MIWSLCLGGTVTGVCPNIRRVTITLTPGFGLALTSTRILGRRHLYEAVEVRSHPC